jgi:hypothetical protein
MHRNPKGKEGLFTTTGTSTQSDQPNLKRHIGIVGLLFASVGSIIGSGWLSGPSTPRKRPDRRR